MAFLAASCIVLPHFVAYGFTNAGNLALTRAVQIAGQDESGDHSIDLLEQGRVWFERALTLNSSHANTRWSLARTALHLGRLGVEANANYMTAARELRPLVINGTRKPPLYQDALTAFSYGGRPDEVIELYETGLPLERTWSVSDTVALAYLQRGTADDLSRARTLRTGDLYVNYHLWQTAQNSNDVRTTAILSSTLRHFPLESVNPTDGRLLEYAGEAIPLLLDEELWTRDKALNVVSFLVWQQKGSTHVERLLQRLIERHPNEPEWSFYLAELYHRQGDLDRAGAAYRDVIATHPDFARTYLRLGMVSESRINGASKDQWLKEAAKWYEQYHTMVPNDLLGLKKIAEVCVALEGAGEDCQSCRQVAQSVTHSSQFDTRGSPATVLQEAVAARVDTRRLVAEILGVPEEKVELGPNLVKNGLFAQWQNSEPVNWQISNMADGVNWNRGTFIYGKDEISGWSDTTAYLNGLWLFQKTDKEPGRWGYWYVGGDELCEIEIDSQHAYLISMMYKTQGIPDSAAKLWLANQSTTFFSNDHALPSTNGSWRMFFAIGFNSREQVEFIRPLVRSFAAGQFWLASVQVRNIRTEAAPDWSDFPVILVR